MSECINDRIRMSVHDRDGHWPTAEAINYGQKMAETIRRWHRDKVYVYMLKPFGRDDKFSDGRDDMFVNFCLLTGNTFPCPFADVLFDVGPNKLVSYGLTRALYSRMTQSMNNIEYSSSI